MTMRGIPSFWDQGHLLSTYCVLDLLVPGPHVYFTSRPFKKWALTPVPWIPRWCKSRSTLSSSPLLSLQNEEGQ